jgi:hypothetical protein
MRLSEILHTILSDISRRIDAIDRRVRLLEVIVAALVVFAFVLLVSIFHSDQMLELLAW